MAIRANQVFQELQEIKDFQVNPAIPEILAYQVQSVHTGPLVLQEISVIQEIPAIQEAKVITVQTVLQEKPAIPV
jgi:hypothetical protein